MSQKQDARGFAYFEDIGFTPVNLKTCVKFSGSPERVKEVIRFIDPVLFKKEYGEEAVDEASKASAGSKE